MKHRFAIVPELTVECQFGLYNGGVECGSSGKYALIDLEDIFICVAHLCSEHALAALKMANAYGG